MEEAVVSAKRMPHPIGGGGATLLAVLGSNTDGNDTAATMAEEGRHGEANAAAFKLMSEQRERARREADELLHENSRLREQYKSHLSEIRRMQANELHCSSSRL